MGHQMHGIGQTSMGYFIPSYRSLQFSSYLGTRNTRAELERDAGLRKSLGNWSFAINWRDIFNSRKMHRTTIGPEYTQEMERWRGGTNIRFTIKYSFGNMKAKRPDKPMMESEMMDSPEFEGGGMQ